MVDNGYARMPDSVSMLWAHHLDDRLSKWANNRDMGLLIGGHGEYYVDLLSQLSIQIVRFTV